MRPDHDRARRARAAVAMVTATRTSHGSEARREGERHELALVAQLGQEDDAEGKHECVDHGNATLAQARLGRLRSSRMDDAGHQGRCLTQSGDTDRGATPWRTGRSSKWPKPSFRAGSGELSERLRRGRGALRQPWNRPASRKATSCTSFPTRTPTSRSVPTDGREGPRRDERGGLEQWRPIMKAEFPVPQRSWRIFDALGRTGAPLVAGDVHARPVHRGACAWGGSAAGAASISDGFATRSAAARRRGHGHFSGR